MIEYEFLVQKLKLEKEVMFIPFNGINHITWEKATPLYLNSGKNVQHILDTFFLDSLVNRVSKIKAGNSENPVDPLVELVIKQQSFEDLFFLQNMTQKRKKIQKLTSEIKKVTS